MITDEQRRKMIEDFDKENGGESMQIGEWICYPTGAMRERNCMGALAPPPENAHQRSKLIVRYWEERLRRVTKAFDYEKKELLIRAQEAERHAASNTPPPPPNQGEIQRLIDLKSTAAFCQQRLEEARAQLADNMPDFLKQREATAAANRVRNAAAIAAIEKLKM